MKKQRKLAKYVWSDTTQVGRWDDVARPAPPNSILRASQSSAAAPPPRSPPAPPVRHEHDGPFEPEDVKVQVEFESKT